jgi:hypothetical protein
MPRAATISGAQPGFVAWRRGRSAETKSAKDIVKQWVNIGLTLTTIKVMEYKKYLIILSQSYIDADLVHTGFIN